MRRDLSRRLLDDPVVYADSLDASTRAYFLNQRGTMAARLSEVAGLVAEQRAEGLALVDETGTLVSPDAAEQSLRAVQNARTALESAGAGLDDVVSWTIYIHQDADLRAAYGAVASMLARDGAPPWSPPRSSRDSACRGR